MRKFLFTFSLLALCAFCGRTVAQTESTSSATITFFRTPSSLLPGVFSVSETKQVRFARGNLQYLASQKIWRIAEHQYDMIGNAPGNTTLEAQRSSQGYWIDMFGWGTSGWSGSGASAYQPWTVDMNNSHYVNIVSNTSWGGGAKANCDWGVFNFNSDLDEGYRVLTRDEWLYLFNRSTTKIGSGMLFGILGLYLLPDDWSWTTVAADTATAHFKWYDKPTGYYKNVISDDDAGRALWSAMEANGAVFLPACGFREGTAVKELDAVYYQTSTCNDGTQNYSVYGTSTQAITVAAGCYKRNGRAIRLVKDYN